VIKVFQVILTRDKAKARQNKALYGKAKAKAMCCKARDLGFKVKA